MDAKRLLGTLLEAGMSPSTQKRIGNALGASGLGKALGGGSVGGGGGKAGGAGGAFPVGAAGLGALAGAVLGGRKGDTLRGVIGGGALAVLGKLAYNAIQERSRAQGAGATGAGPAAGETIVPGGGWGATPARSPGEEEAGARLLLRAMVSAAKADGQIDGHEMQRILQKLDEAGADPEDKGFILDEMRKPLDVAALAREAGGSPEVAAQLYAASLLAIEVDTPAERDYLRRLAAALGLDEAAVGRLHASLGAAR
jgi:uncharacterized membrane protein YebE (DUF533 family)